KDMTRVARLNEDMWTELFLANQEPLLNELDTLLHSLEKYREALASGDAPALHALLRSGRERKEMADREDDEP
ncbi:MAG: prephenate dehydrogenase dimerization domain-containing protein, partial [Clostridia bacterium]